MFSLIITLVSIALVAALALATLYYGGSSWLRGNAAASAATLANQGQQVLAALTLYYTDHSAYPADLQELVTGDYLKTVPVPPSTAALEPGLVAPALAAGEAWTLVAAGQPAAMVREAVSREVCQEVNYRLLGSDAVREKARTDVAAQCFGPAAGPFTFVVGMPADETSTASLARAFEHYNDAHAGAPLAVVTAAAPENPVTVPETRNASQGAGGPAAPTGVTLAFGALAPQASVAAGDGGALLRATGTLSINGTVSVPLTLERSVSAANLATVARAAAWSTGPSVLPGLTLADINWNGTFWEYVGPTYVEPAGVSANRAWTHSAGGGGACTSYAQKCSFDAAVAALVARQESGAWDQVSVGGAFVYKWGSCSDPNALCEYTVPLKYWQFSAWHVYSGYSVLGYGADGPAAARSGAATQSDVETKISTALQTQPSSAGDVLDAALATEEGAAQLQPGALSTSGPATATSGDTTFELTYLGGAVNVSDGEASASTVVTWP